MNKRGQSEFVGFAIIVIIVAVLIVVFLSFSLNKSSEETVKSYETESFVNSILEYTSTCEKLSGSSNPVFLSIRTLISSCIREDSCLDGTPSCEVLNETLKDLVESSWKTGNDWPTKGYELVLMYEGNNLINWTKGNITSQSKGSIQNLPVDIDLIFTVYS